MNAGFRIIFGHQLTSKLVATRPFLQGQVICTLEGFQVAPKAYTTVQMGINQHVELHSSLTFMNHSCAPSCHINTSSFQLTAAKDIPAGQELTFFYPSTEWDMDSPFKCWCRCDRCIGQVRGAKYLDFDVLASYAPLNAHIIQLKREQLESMIAKLKQSNSSSSPSTLTSPSA